MNKKISVICMIEPPKTHNELTEWMQGYNESTEENVKEEIEKWTVFHYIAHKHQNLKKDKPNSVTVQKVNWKKK